MSEESQVFRGDRQPESSQIEPSAPVKKSTPVPAAVPPVSEVRPTPEPESRETPEDPPPPTAHAPAKPEPALNLSVDESQLWHVPETLQQRIAQLSSTAAETAHQLDEQEEKSVEIAKRLRSL